jgi:hypothetical protein
MYVRFAQSFDRTAEIIDVDDDAIPAARLRFASVQHRFGGAAWSKRCAQHHDEIVTGDHRKIGIRRDFVFDLKSEVLRIE